MRNVRFESAEETLEALRIATEAAALGIWDLNVISGEFHCSDRLLLIFGRQHDVNLRYDDLLAQAEAGQRKEVQKALQEAFDPLGAGEFRMDSRITLPNQESRWICARGKAFFEDLDGRRRATRFIGTVLDETDQKRTRHGLLEAERLAATGRLAASIAHEINNPLEAVTNLLYLLKREDDEQQRETYLSLAESELARVTEIVSNTLQFYRDPAGISEVNVGRLIHSVLSLFHGHVAVRKIDLHLDIHDNMSVSASQGELRQVLVNLMSNAVDAMPDGGRLHVRCRRQRRLSGAARGSIRLSIADTGEGMEPEVRKRIFEPFFTTKGSSGTGLGLWLSTDILRKHGFKLRVKSKRRHGSVFSVFMPEGVPTPA